MDSKLDGFSPTEKGQWSMLESAIHPRGFRDALAS